MMAGRIVVDTNVYISRLIRPESVPGRALAQVWERDRALISHAAWLGLGIAVRRAKFARYIQASAIEPYLHYVWLVAEAVEIQSSIRVCRDPRDDKFLELAVDGRAGVIITGDNDLLALHPFQGIQILTPADFLRRA